MSAAAPAAARVVAVTGSASGIGAAVNYFGAVELLDAMLPALAVGARPSAVVIASNSAGFVPPDLRLVDALLAGAVDAAAQAAAGLDGATAYATGKLTLIRAVRRRAGSWGPGPTSMLADVPVDQATRQAGVPGQEPG